MCFVPFVHGCITAPVTMPVWAHSMHLVNVCQLGAQMDVLGVRDPRMGKTAPTKRVWTKGSPPTFWSPNPCAQLKIIKDPKELM